MCMDNLRFCTFYGYMLVFINNILVCYCHDCFESSVLTLVSVALKIKCPNDSYVCRTTASLFSQSM
jgi:hypothetical protein